MIFDKRTKTILWVNDSLFNKWRFSTKLDPYPTPYTKINSKCIKNLNVRPKTIKLSVENIEQKLHNTGFGNAFLNMTPKAQATKEKIDKLDFMKI